MKDTRQKTEVITLEMGYRKYDRINLNVLEVV
jgi:hypothetical protein